MFEGIITDDPEQRTLTFKIKVWKVGSTINAIYIILVPQTILVLSDVLRGVTDWNFIRAKDSYDSVFLEHNSSLLKYRYGNIVFAVIVCTLCTGGLAFLVWRVKKMFEQESDILAFRYHDATRWTVSWVRESSSIHGQTNELEVNIRTISHQ